MKTLLFAPLFIDGDYRLQRNIKWIDYIMSIKENLEFNKILFVDNASGPNLSIFEEYIKKYSFPIEIIRCDVRMERITTDAYPYWYRAFARACEFALDEYFNKIIHLDTDVYPTTLKMTNWINSQNLGWVAPFCFMHNYPETTLQIICEDRLAEAYWWFREDFLQFYPYDIAEKRIPYTFIDKSLNGDRFGERNIKQDSTMDWYGQCPNDLIIKFNMENK